MLLLLAAQLAGETVVRATGLALPGPVLGMVFTLILLASVPRVSETLRPIAQAILMNLSLLFVPAGVGVIGHVATLGSQTMAIMAAVVGSTILAIIAAALTFAAVARMTGSRDE